jgi:hypothetical protein
LSGTNNIYVYYTSPITQVIAPGQGTVNTTALGNITNIASGNSSLTLQTGSGNTTAVTIDTNQNVGIGTASPANKLHVSDTTTSTVKTRTQASTGYVDVGMGGNSGVFDTTATDGIRLRMSGNDKVAIDGSTLALPGLQGIKFQATQSASSDANTLDDYEEGTWTTTFSSVSGSLTAYTSGGYYLKVGGLVTIYGWARITTAGTAAGGGRILSLPFSIANANTNYYRNQGLAQESQNTGLLYQFFPVDSSTLYMLTPTNGAITWTAGYTYPFQITYQST